MRKRRDEKNEYMMKLKWRGVKRMCQMTGRNQLYYVVSIYKNGDRKQCNNYIVIALLETVYKISATVIRNRLQST